MKIRIRTLMLCSMVSIILHGSAVVISAQSRITSSIVKVSGNNSSGYGRDSWFAIPMNYSPKDRSSKYFNIYVNSPRNTTVNFQITGGPIIKKPVTAGQVAIFTSPTPRKPSSDIPLSTEMYTSGVVEPKAIHVWSDDADIAVYLLSRRDYSSGGTYVLPSAGWGKEYIVGAYESIFDPSGQADWPSEFAIIADKDSTIVTITPSWDIRYDGFPSMIEHPKHVPFTVTMNRGECVQYQTVLPINDGECDLTGTIITSNNPVGVMGCAVDPYIYFPFGYGDYCLSMLQPVRSWSDKYFTAPFAGRKYGGDAYCVIATKQQTIYRNGVKVTDLAKYADHLFIYDDQGPSPPALWTSDAPFELMQYIPSATFGTGDPLAGKRNQGDADMCNMNPADQFIKKMYFQTPTIDPSSGQTGFTNYVNILLPSSHEASTIYDGTPLNSGLFPPNVVKLERLPIAGTLWEAIRLTYKASSGEGYHLVTSDTGIGVYLYGYATDDSYSWNATLGLVDHNSPDTLPPVAIISGECLHSHVRISDSRKDDSKLSSFVIDSSYNISFLPDSNFLPGIGSDSSFYDLQVIDYTQEAYAAVSVYDLAGNRTTVTSTYKALPVSFTPTQANFGSVNVGSSKSLYFTVTNNGTIPFSWQSIKLLLGNHGFAIDSGLVPNTPIPAGGTRIIKVKYTATTSSLESDTLELSDGCIGPKIILTAGGVQPDFTLTDHDFKCVDIGATKIDTAVVVFNAASSVILIDSITLDDQVHFSRADNNLLPITLPPSGSFKFLFSFTPDKAGSFSTLVHFHSIEIGWRQSTLIGCGQIPSAVTSDSYTSSLSKGSSEYSAISSQLDHGADLAILPPVPNPVTAGNGSIKFFYGLRSESTVNLSIYDILGNPVASVIHSGHENAGIYEATYQISPILASGSYIYRLAAGGKVLSGRFVITR